MFQNCYKHITKLTVSWVVIRSFTNLYYHDIYYLIYHLFIMFVRWKYSYVLVYPNPPRHVCPRNPTWHDQQNTFVHKTQFDIIVQSYIIAYHFMIDNLTHSGIIAYQTQPDIFARQFHDWHPKHPNMLDQPTQPKMIVFFMNYTS